MDLQIFKKFDDIPGSNLIIDQIPVFANQCYADYLKELKNQDTIWFVNFENNKVSFLLPFVIYKILLFKKGYCQTEVISLNPNNSLEKEKEFLNKVVSYLRKNRLCDWIQQGPNWALFKTFPSGSKAVKFGTYKIFLKNKTEEELFNSLNRNIRQDINRAKRELVQIKKGIANLNDCLLIINETARKANISVLTKTEVDKLRYYLKNELKIYVSYFDNIPQGSSLFLGNKYCTYALYSGSIPKAFRGSNVYSEWEAIMDAKNEGSKCFDFVGARINPEPGSKLERIQIYKSRFGSEFIDGYIWKIVLSKIKYRIYNNLLKMYYLIKNIKYKKDIIDQEFEKQNSENTNSDN